MAEVTAVYASDVATRFHKTAACTAFRSAQQLNDWDCDCGGEYGCGHRSPRLGQVQRYTLNEAIAAGKLPCWACYRGQLALPPSTEDFGHVPVNDYATVPLDCTALVRIVCARCIVWRYQRDVDMYFGRRVAWPCTSAVVLGMVPRSCPTCLGDKCDPEHPGDWLPEFQRHDPYTRPPCPQCLGRGHLGEAA